MALEVSDSITSGILRSIETDSIVVVMVSDLDDALAEALADEDYHTDSSEEDNGDIDVWGWTDESKPGQMDWRIRLRVQE